MSFLVNKAAAAAHSLQDSAKLNNVTNKINLGSITNVVSGLVGAPDASLKHRYNSSAPIQEGNSVKFHVDGCAYFWAVSEALEKVKESVWILGCEYLC